MANVDAEQNAASLEQTGEGVPSESITLSEENLEALLNGVRGVAPAPRPNPVPAPAPDAPAAASSPARRASETIGPVKKEEPAASLASLQEALPVQAVPPPPFEVSPGAVAPLQAPPQAAAQPDVNSKLALISAIKQRRAVSPRPEPVSEPERFSPTLPVEQNEEAAAVDGPEPEEAATVQQEAATKVERQAPDMRRPAPAAKATAPLVTKPVTEAQLQTSLPAKKVWTNNSAGAPAERESRRSDPRPETPRPEVVRKPAPRATVAAPPAEPYEAPESPETFARFGSGLLQQEAAKPASFITSKAGMGVIGGAIAAAALTVYLLTAHSTKKDVATTSAPASAPVQVPAVAPPAPANDAKSAAPIAGNTANQRLTPSPLLTQGQGIKPVSAAPAAGFVPQVALPNASAQQGIAPQQSVAQENPRTVARAFTAPNAARPTSNPLVDAAPNVAVNSGNVALPTRIAPLPPPPAPAAPATPAAAAQQRPLNVAGGAQAAKLTHQVVPTYPAVAKAARVQGTVRFRAVIGTDGAVKSLTTLGGPLPLAQAASDAVKQWHYQPTVIDGKAVEVTTQIDVAFTL